VTLALTDHELDALEKRLASEKERRVVENALAHYKPYEAQRSFHEAGATHRERLLCAGNQTGKTYAGGMEAAMHATGLYPDWWRGRRFDRPTVAWVASVSGLATRDSPQRVLMGRPGQHGTGTIPKHLIGATTTARNVSDLLDTVQVRHISGGWSTIGFRTYEMDRTKFQGETLSWAWLDEEPPIDIYTEALTRLNVGQGPIFMTLTPLLGMSEVVRRYLLEPAPDRHVTVMTIDDAEHYSPEDRAAIIASYPPHEREARTKGIPTLGSGRVFPIVEEAIVCDAFDIPPHWPRLGAMDFGWSHFAAFVELAHDRDTDTIYIVKCHRVREQTPILHAAAVKPWGKLQWAWPHDGNHATLAGAGIPLVEQYRAQGLDMLFEKAQFLDGSQSVEAGIAEILSRMETGRFKVFKHLLPWLEEFRMYHRSPKDGRIVKERDDLMSATRYGVMMLRHARVVRDRRQVIEYPREWGMIA
jgi:phage terminase large subunit-like protein